MGVLDDLRDSYGDDVLEPRPRGQAAHSWSEVCPCGHTDRYHSPSVGGSYVLKEPYTKRQGGVEYLMTVAFYGCAGALPPKGFERETPTDPDHEAKTGIIRINPTCPCDAFRPVARVDKPNRYFCQRMPLDRKDPMRHPFVIGIKAFSTHLSRRKDADPDRGGDPTWATAEFDRRFTWLDGARVCGLSKCSTTDGVWPVFMADGDRSELRCAAHR